MNKETEIPEDTFPSDEDFDDEEDSDSSSDVEEKLASEDVFDVEFLKCYSALKRKDEKIYDKNVKFFSENKESQESGDEEQKDESPDANTANNNVHSDVNQKLAKINKTVKKPKMTLLDHQLKFIEGNESDNEDIGHKVDLNKPVDKSFYEKELDAIKKNIEKVSEAIHSSDSEDDLLIVKGESSQPKQRNDKKKINSILDKIEQEEEDEDLDHLRQLWNNPDSKLADDEKFLRDYILNKKYLAVKTPGEKKEKGGDEDDKAGFFSKNLDEISDDDTEQLEKINPTETQVKHHSDEKDFDRISRIPRNATSTIRDLVEKQHKKEKRLKKLDKLKKKKNNLKDADFEDMVGDMPTKFQYRETVPNDYGLSAEELLIATDEELEKWISLRKAIAFKNPEQEIYDKKEFEKRRNDIELKKKIFVSMYGDKREGEGAEGQESEIEAESKKSKKRKRTESQTSEKSLEVSNPHTSTQDPEKTISKKKKKKKNRCVNHKKFAKVGVAPDRLLAYGLSKNKLKKSNLL